MILLPVVLALLSSLYSPALAAVVSPNDNNESLLWGPYRPNLYLGIRPRVPENGLMAGLMWGQSEHIETSMRNSKIGFLVR